MKFQQRCPKSALRVVATLLLFFAAFSRGLLGDVVLETGFEGSSGLPVGWSLSEISGSATVKFQTGGGFGRPGAANSGSNNATIYASNFSDNITRLITPTFDTVGYTTVTLSFYHAQPVWVYEGSSDQDELKVFYSDDGGSSWTELAHYTDDIPNWTQRTLNLPSTSANSRIAFEANARYGYGVSLDDIAVTGSPSLKSTFSVTTTDGNASEEGPDSGRWTITRTGNTTEALSVDYILSGSATAGLDYTVDTPSPISFAPGQTSVVITMTPVDDTVAVEDGESATLSLEPDPAYFIDNASADIPISDNDLADLNILILGSDRSFSEKRESDVVHEKAFNPAGIASHLKEIIDQQQLITDSVNVVHNSIYKEKTQTVNYDASSTYSFTSHCYSLAQHYMWPEGKEDRLADLRGEGEAEWDYIVLSFDPYILANFPGMVAEGVKLIHEEVSRSENPAQVVLLAQWPENSSIFNADDFNEVVYRVGDSADLPVVPAGKAWDTLPAQDTNAAHPTPHGEYLAASALYSWFYGDSASSSNYTYLDASTTSAIADHALSVVQANAGAPQYTGAYTSINPFQMKYVSKRLVNFRETGTSTEDRIRFALNRLDNVQRINFSSSGYSGDSGTRWDFNYGRGNDWWEDAKDYEVDPGKYDRSYGFPMHHYTTSNAPITMPYGIDKHYWNGTSYEDGTDLGIAYNMIRPNTRELSLPEDVRAIPIRLMWLKMREISPGFNPLGDSTHMGPHLNDATAAFMYTLLSGRCPVVEEPATEGSTEWLQWLGHKIGYETAWQMSHLTTRAPGFRVLPSSTSATTVSSATSEIMTVQFANPPQEDVTVTVSVSSSAAAIVSPKTLVFTPSNHNTPQEVTVVGIPGATASEPFEVRFSTHSDDGVYDGLSDAWAYTNNRSSTESVTQVDNGSAQEVTAQYTPVDIDLGVAGANAGNTTFAGPSHGSIAWTGTEDIQYTPDGDFLGSDQIAYAVTIGGTQTIGTIDLSVQLPDGQVNASAEDATASEEGPDSGTFLISRLGDSAEALDIFFTLGGTADLGADYTLSHTSPVTIPAGQVSLTLTLTPVDDAVFGEREETAVLTVTEDSAYPVGLAAATITIADNDNNIPVADAGPDQQVSLQDNGSGGGGDPVAGAYYEWDASDDTTDDAVWPSSPPNTYDWTFDGGTLSPVDVSDPRFNTITRAYVFPAAKDGSNASFDSTGGTAQPATFEFVLDVDGSEGSIFETGGSGDGLQVDVSGGVLRGTVQENPPARVTYALTATDLDRFIHVVFVADQANDVVQLYVDGELEDSQPWTGNDWAGGDNASLGSMSNTRPTDGSTADFSGQIGLFRFYNNKAFDATEVAANLDAIRGGPSAEAQLNAAGSSDADNQPLSYAWEFVSGPESVDFSDPNVVNPAVTFFAAGTYELRVKVDDGTDTDSDTVLISVAPVNSFASWISGYDVGGLTAPGDDYDGDGIPNAVENYFGTHPGTYNAGLAITQVVTGGAGDSTFEFSHPINENPASDLTATYRWSKDLATFHDGGSSDGARTVSFVLGAPVGGEVSVVATITGEQTDRLFITVGVN